MIRYWCKFALFSLAINAVWFGLLAAGYRHALRDIAARQESAPVVWDTEVLATEAGYVQHGYSRTGAVVWRQSDPPVPTPFVGTVVPAAAPAPAITVDHAAMPATQDTADTWRELAERARRSADTWQSIASTWRRTAETLQRNNEILRSMLADARAGTATSAATSPSHTEQQMGCSQSTSTSRAQDHTANQIIGR